MVYIQHFDFGMGIKFVNNAEKMAIDLSDVDIAFISHGHFDHGRGLEQFLKINSKALIYIQKTTFGKYYLRTKIGKYHYGGLDQKLATNPRLIVLDGSAIIDDELQITSKVPPKREIRNLFMKENGKMLPDIFNHEQSLVISENRKKILVSGCSHTGIDRILSVSEKVCGKIDFVLGGFHLIAYNFKKPEDLAEIDELANQLLKRDTMYYTCHCTGTLGYKRLKEVMGDRIGYLSTGNTIWI